MNIIIETFWLLLPAGIANMAPVLFKWVPLLNCPVDFGKTFRGQRIFGAHKTYRGFLFGTLAAIAIVFLQIHLTSTHPETFLPYSIFDYSTINPWLVGFLLGFGALLGDSIKSFFKRQAGVKSGNPWPPFDQVDWVIGSLGLLSLHVAVSWSHFGTALLLFLILHPAVNYLGYLLKIKKNKW